MRSIEWRGRMLMVLAGIVFPLATVVAGRAPHAEATDLAPLQTSPATHESMLVRGDVASPVGPVDPDAALAHAIGEGVRIDNPGDDPAVGDGSQGDFFGYSVALSNDIALVGVPWDQTPAGVDAGSVYVFERTAEGWLRRGKLAPAAAAPGDRFGGSVATDGNIAVISATGADTPQGVDSGAVHVFVRNGTAWIEQARLVGSDVAAEDFFGTSLALSGNTLVIGASRADSPVQANGGAAYVFVGAAQTWQEQAKLVASHAIPGGGFGASVAASGETIVVGAVGSSGLGSAHVFTRTPSAWAQAAVFQPDDRSNLFGRSVAIDGDLAVVGDATAGTSGAAYFYARTGAGWSQTAKVESGNGGDQFGWSVALRGNVALIGAKHANASGGFMAGAAYLYGRSGGAWIQRSRLEAPDGARYSSFGNAVAMNGSAYLVGAYESATMAGFEAGKAYLFNATETAAAFEQTLTAGLGGSGARFGAAVAISDATAVVGAPSTALPSGNAAGAAQVFARGGNGWTRQAMLVADDARAEDLFGAAVAVAGDFILVGAAEADLPARNDAGAVYVFKRAGTTWVQHAKLMAPVPRAYARFGTALALSHTRAVIGAPREDGSGVVYVFSRTGSNWKFTQRIIADVPADSGGLGSSLALDEDTMVAGAPSSRADPGVGEGAVYLFTNDGNSWNQKARLSAPVSVTGHYFGRSVAIAGSTILVGAWRHASVYERSGDAWSHSTELVPTDGLPMDGGLAVALWKDMAVVGVPMLTEPHSYESAAHVFARVGAGWVQTNRLAPALNAVPASFGTAVSVSNHALVIGSPDEVGARSGDGAVGAVYLYANDTLFVDGFEGASTEAAQ